jgi:hypothetical protein
VAFSALPIERAKRSGETGLTTKSNAPARIALTTISIPPWLVWTITGILDFAAVRRSSTSSPPIPGIIRSSTSASMAGPSDVKRSKAERPLSNISQDMTSAFTRRLEQTALHRIIINNHNSTGHGFRFLVFAIRLDGYRLKATLPAKPENRISGKDCILMAAARKTGTSHCRPPL